MGRRVHANCQPTVPRFAGGFERDHGASDTLVRWDIRTQNAVKEVNPSRSLTGSGRLLPAPTRWPPIDSCRPERASRDRQLSTDTKWDTTQCHRRILRLRQIVPNTRVEKDRAS